VWDAAKDRSARAEMHARTSMSSPAGAGASFTR
jgi:hypothetical protein